VRQHILSLVERYLGRGHFSGGENISVPCPFHQTKDGTPFSVNVTNGVWQCFSCHASGSLPSLLRRLGLPSHRIDVELKDIRDELIANKKRVQRGKVARWVAKDPFLAETVLPETLLKPYEWCPLNLVNAGFDSQWLHWLDVGFDRNTNRVMYPIRDIYGNLAGMSGGSVIAGTQPKYKVYLGKYKVLDLSTGKEREVGSDYGPWFDEQFPSYIFHNHNYIWNFDQVYPRLFFGKDPLDLIIVEGFKACMWLLQHGWANTVALMGSSMSDHQRSLIHRVNCRVILFLDNDEAGRDGTDDIARTIRHFQPGVLIAQYPADAKQPDDLAPEELTAAIQGAETYPEWKRRTRHVNGRTKKRSF
jgi:5S rRNA maturation endonuclease (ribonuclease M5)